MPTLVVASALALLQGASASAGNSSPADGDTVGYWQQRVHYKITATLDERAQRVRANGTMWYVNNSPDTLREMYFHQYLNAFRPASKWSEADEREGRLRFQALRDPDYGYERFTAPLRVNGAVVRTEYPGAPDSTVVRITLPTPLAPRDSFLVAFAWDARPSTTPRRQGRRGRHWDLAQWYPKVAVYDRGGWQQNALRPAGEFYGEFGVYDVTLIVANDQVVAATGVPVSGDPGWSRVLRGGVSRTASKAYQDAADAPVAAPPGFKAVRFYAKDVHHFAWSASPDYRYEGGVFARAVPAMRFPTWDTVSIHVLYRAGDDTTWGGQRVVNRTVNAMKWLEAVFGPYAYPQMTVLHRLDGGGTEFPMMQMNGSPSQGLILHEGGHGWAYGILANNEWRAGWMDEGLTSYQTAWAQLLTPQERYRAGIIDQPVPRRGYRSRAIRMTLPRFEVVAVNQTARDLLGRAEPMGKVAHEFRDFDTYNDMVYDRAELMYSQLRDVLGDSVFVGFLRDYYARWALKHVDERAMRASAERVSGRNLGWFFDQWVHRTGVMDYRLGRVQTRRVGDRYVTLADVRQVGEYRHPMNVGVRTATGWSLGRMADEPRERDPYGRSTVRIATSSEPLEVRLDPHHVTWDWDRRNDVQSLHPLLATRVAFDWPFLEQAHRDRMLILLRPVAWYSEPGGVSAGLRGRANYLGWLDRYDVGAAWVSGRRSALSEPQRLQWWYRRENPAFWRRPAVGWRWGAALLDDIFKFDVGRKREHQAGARKRLVDVAATVTGAIGEELVPELWDDKPLRAEWTADLAGRTRWVFGKPDGSHSFVEQGAVAGFCEGCSYAKVELSIGHVRTPSENTRVAGRAYAGGTFGGRVPMQRALLLSAADPVSTFENHWWRPRGSILKRPNANWLPLGGAALRGFHWSERTARAGAVNAELSRRLVTLGSRADTLGIWLTAFGDAGVIPGSNVIYDAGPGLTLRGKLYDLPINARFDFPILISDPARAIDRGHAGRGKLAPRWVITFNDIW